MAADLDTFLIGSFDTSGYALAVAISGHHAYVADGPGGLQVIDVSNPTHPQRVGGCETGGYAQGVVVQAQYAYVADATNGVVVIDVSDPTNPRQVGAYGAGGGANGVVVSGNHAYVAEMTNGLQVLDTTDPAAPKLVGTYGAGQFNAKAVALSGNLLYFSYWPSSGVEVLDISDPANPQYLGRCYEDPASGFAVTSNYVYVVYGGLKVVDVSTPYFEQGGTWWSRYARANAVALCGNYAYVADYEGGLQIVDVSDFYLPEIVGSCYIPGGYAMGVAVANNLAFVVNGDGGLQVIDVGKLANPQREARSGFGWYDHVFDVSLSGHYAYVGAYRAFEIYDVSDLKQPIRTGYYSFWDQNARAVAVSGQYAFVSAGALYVMDVSNPVLPQAITNYIPTGPTADGVSAVRIAGNFAYLAVGRNGFEILDVSNPVNPRSLARLDTPGNASRVAISSNYAYVADGDSGLEIIDVSNGSSPVWACRYDIITATDVALSGNFAYVLDGNKSNGLYILDLSNPMNPQKRGWCPIPGVPRGVSVLGNYAYVADYIGGLQVIDVTDATKPVRIGGSSAIVVAYGVTSGGDHVFVAGGEQGLVILNTFTPLDGPTLSLLAPRLENNTFHVSVQGLPGLEVGIERSTNLVNWQGWTNGVLGRGAAQFLDEGSGTGRRFYRAVTR